MRIKIPKNKYIIQILQKVFVLLYEERNFVVTIYETDVEINTRPFHKFLPNKLYA